MKTFVKSALMVALVAFTTSCENEPAPAEDGTFHIELDYVWAMNQTPFEMNTTLYHPMTMDSLNFTTFQHFISNVKLHALDGTVWEDTESYYLVDASDASTMNIEFTGVPAGEYDRVEFTLGVDSLRNVSGVQSGALDPSTGMFWSWNTGYIMLKAEGSSQAGMFAYHLGGFSGPNKAVNEKSLGFPVDQNLNVRSDAAPVVHLKANVAKLFHTAGTVADNPMVHMPGETAGIMANDFAGSVVVDHIHN